MFLLSGGEEMGRVGGDKRRAQVGKDFDTDSRVIPSALKGLEAKG